MKTAICAIVKDERRFIKEWADWHLSIGVDKIHVFEDYGSVSHADIFVDEPRVEVMPISEYGVNNSYSSHTQLTLYKKFLHETKVNGTYDWILFIDVDEFLMFEKDYNLARLENEYDKAPAIYLCWKCYNANGHIRRPDGGIMENYTKVSPLCDTLMWCLKSMVNVKHCIGMHTLHHAIGGVKTNGVREYESDVTYNKAWLNHYFSKSFEDYCCRMFERGNLYNNCRSFDAFFNSNPELMPRMRELIESVRYKHCKGTMWISHRLGLISGGNISKLKEIKKKIQKCLE